MKYQQNQTKFMNSARSKPITRQTDKGIGKSFKRNYGSCQ